MAKNICFYLTRYPGWGGIEAVTTLIINKLKKSNLDYHIIIVSHLKQETGQILPAVKIYHLPNWENWPNEYKWNTELFQDSVETILKVENIDTLIYQDSYAPTEDIVINIAKKFNIKLFVFEHNTPLYNILEYRQRPKKTLRSRLYHPYAIYKAIKRKKKLYNSCEKYVVLSKEYIDEFVKLTHVKDISKITYINNPINFETLVPFHQEKENIILFVGRMTKIKGVDSILSAWKIISREFKEWKMVCVGDGDELSELRQKVLSEKIQNVEFTGFQSPSAYYAKSKIFWMMSEFEGWPMTIGESMLNGCVPVVYDSFSAVNDMIDDKRNGYIIENHNQQDFIDKTVSLMLNQKKLDSFSAECVSKANEFNIDIIIREWLQLLQ